MNWNQRCSLAVRREKAEVEQRYGIVIGQTNITCARCGRPWGFGQHTCQEIRLQKLNEAKKTSKEAVKTDVPLSQSVSGEKSRSTRPERV